MVKGRRRIDEVDMISGTGLWKVWEDVFEEEMGDAGAGIGGSDYHQVMCLDWARDC